MTTSNTTKAARRKRAATRGETLRADVEREWELSPHEAAILTEACRALDVIDDLAAVLAREGATVTRPSGVTVVHPAAVELRQQQVTVSRLLGSLGLRDADGAPAVLTPFQTRSAAGNTARWGRDRDPVPRRGAAS